MGGSNRQTTMACFIRAERGASRFLLWFSIAGPRREKEGSAGCLQPSAVAMEGTATEETAAHTSRAPTPFCCDADSFHEERFVELSIIDRALPKQATPASTTSSVDNSLAPEVASEPEETSPCSRRPMLQTRKKKLIIRRLASFWSSHGQ